jgi:two-component system sensor kinase FixL
MNRWRHTPAAAATAAAYFLGAKLGFALTLAPVPVSTLWPPNAILLAALILIPLRGWPSTLAAVLLAHLAVQFQSGVPAGMVLGWYASNCTEAALGALLLRRYAGGPPTFSTFRSCLTFLLCAGFAAPFFTSFLDAGFVALNQWGDAGYATVWRTRFFSNVLATLTLVPFILLSIENLPRLRDIPRRRMAEAVTALSGLAAVCWFVFSTPVGGTPASAALLYAPLPLLIAAAIRFGPWGASASMLLVAVIAIWNAVHGQGPFLGSSSLQNALSIQLFLIVAWAPVMFVAAVLRDRAAAETRARVSEEQLAIALDAAQLGRWEWDVVTQQLTWSDVTRRMYEVPLDGPVNPRTFERLVHPDDMPAIAAATAEAAAGRAFEVEFRIRMDDGRIKWIYSKGKAVFDADGQPVRIVGVKVDVTARKSSELRMKELEREVAHSSRVAIAGECSLHLARELKQPLAAILANASAARRYLTHDPPNLSELQEIVESIAADNRRAAAVVTQFSDTLRQDGGWSAVDLVQTVNGAVDVARGELISRGVSLKTRSARDLPPVCGDPLQLQQVLMNLIVNACDAMEAVPQESRRVLVEVERHDGEELLLTVSDRGPGVPDGLGDHIFEPFVSTRPGRLGLGLAICRSVVSLHGGRLWVDSALGGGARFCLALPAMAPGGRSESAGHAMQQPIS